MYTYYTWEDWAGDEIDWMNKSVIRNLSTIEKNRPKVTFPQDLQDNN